MYEEFSTVLMQIEAVLNSRLLAPFPTPDDALEPLTPVHFLNGRPLESLSFSSFTLLRQWHLCQNLTHHFWTRWSTEYLVSLDKLSKWKSPSKNIGVGDVVVLQEDGLIPVSQGHKSASWPRWYCACGHHQSSVWNLQASCNKVGTFAA